MADSTTSCAGVVSIWDEVRQLLRRRMLEAIELLLDEELTAGLGCGPYERSGERCGYRNGSERRRITTEVGLAELEAPRGRVWRPDGSTAEFRSRILPRYARRSRQVDEALMGAYLAGVNTRRIRRALEPLVGEAHLSRSAVSRVVGRLKKLFETWEARDLSQESYSILFLDALNLKVRLAGRVVSVPVLAVLGVSEGGQKHLVALRLAVRESATSWGDLVGDLKKRGLQGPLLLVSDGHPGLAKALECWPGARVQRSTVHKLRNLLKHCPPHAHSELKRDYYPIVCARDGLKAREAYDAFLAKWSRLCPPVARSLEQGGLRLLTFYEFPRAMWKSLRSTNTLENLNREFRRRTKTQASFSTEQAAVTLLYGLVAFGQIRLRRIDGHRHLRTLERKLLNQAA